MQLPQIIMIALLAMSLGVYLANHGKPKTGEYNFWVGVIATAIQTALLVWGGFFN
jgi:hypothetical protein